MFPPLHRGMRTLLLALAIAAPLRAAPPDVAAVDPGWILERLARSVPARTPFVELRVSPLLKAPLRVSGEYSRPDRDTLVREVRAPYRETATLHGGEARIVRKGQPERRYSLAQVPELAGLQASFGALLAGDRAALERDYRIATEGTRARWTLTLTPKAPALAAKVKEVALYGRGAELRCIETRPARGAEQRTLLAGAAQAAEAVTDAAAIMALCRGGER